MTVEFMPDSDGPFFYLVSPDGSKQYKLGLTNDGIVTADNIPIFTNEDVGYEEYIYDNQGRTSTAIFWTDNTKTVKLREYLTTYASNRIESLVTKIYVSGILVRTITENYTYTVNRLTSKTRTIS